VERLGDGKGIIESVRATPAIRCGEGCASQGASYPHGTEVTLRATRGSDPFTVFTGWSGDACVGQTQPECIVEMTGDKVVKARFETYSHAAILLQASITYDTATEVWGSDSLDHAGKVRIPGALAIVDGNVGDHYPFIDFAGIVACYQGVIQLPGKGNQPGVKFKKTIRRPAGPLDSGVVATLCKYDTAEAPDLGLLADALIPLQRGDVITLVHTNRDNRNPPTSTPNGTGRISVAIDVVEWTGP
jgi:hypothetical protein